MNSRISCSRSADGSRGIAYFVEDPRLQTRPQTTRRGKIYWSAENFSQTITQGGKLEKIRDLLEFNENIDIAFRARFAASYRAVDAQSANSGARQFGAMGVDAFEEVFGCHDLHIGKYSGSPSS